MGHAARLVFHRARGIGSLCVTGALFAAFLIGWLSGTVLQLLSAMLPRSGGRDDPIRVRMAQEVQRYQEYYDDVLLHGRVT